MEERKCCDENILEKIERDVEREEERQWREKTSNSERWKEKGVGESIEQCVAFKHNNIEGNS